jgi:hypothetical protein
METKKQPYNPRLADTANKPAADSGLNKESQDEFPLSAHNFKWMGVAAAMIVLGFVLMLGSGSTEEFNPDIFSARRVVVGPTIAFLGFVAMAIAIIIRKKK